jgi:hypothetical protein
MMTAHGPQPDSHVFSIRTAHFAGLITGHHASGRIDMTVRAAGGPTLVSITDGDVEIPEGLPVVDHLVAAAMIGTVSYVTREGRRVAAVVPADIAESMLQDPPDAPDDDHPGPGGGGARRRMVEELCREQGVRPVQDPDELDGVEMADFDEFFSAAMSARSR